MEEIVNNPVVEPEKKEGPLDKIKRNNTPLLVAGLVILTAVLVILAVPIKQAAHITSPTVKKEMPTGTLKIAQPISLGGANYSADILVDSDKYSLAGTDLILKYDPKQISNFKVSNGSFFANPSTLYNQVDTKTGIATYSAVTGVGYTPVKGKGTIAVVTFTLIGSPSSSVNVSFEKGTHLAAQGQNSSVLGDATGLKFSP